MSDEKIRVNLVISRKNHRELKRLAERVPNGFTMSGFVDEMLDSTVPAMHEMLDQSEKDPNFLEDEEKQDTKMMELLVQQALKNIMGSKDLIHTITQLGEQLKKESK